MLALKPREKAVPPPPHPQRVLYPGSRHHPVVNWVSLSQPPPKGWNNWSAIALCWPLLEPVNGFACQPPNWDKHCQSSPVSPPDHVYFSMYANPILNYPAKNLPQGMPNIQCMLQMLVWSRRQKQQLPTNKVDSKKNSYLVFEWATCYASERN